MGQKVFSFFTAWGIDWLALFAIITAMNDNAIVPYGVVYNVSEV